MSKVRMIVVLEGRTYYGKHVYERVRQYAEAYHVPRLPDELKGAPKWRKIIWKFEQLPVAKKKLFVFRELGRVQANRSQYVAKLAEMGHGKRLKRKNWHRPPQARVRLPRAVRADRDVRAGRREQPMAAPQGPVPPGILAQNPWAQVRLR